jgi:hypothetical protein
MPELTLLYPELQKFGGLPKALQSELFTVAPNLRVEGLDFSELKKFEENHGILHMPSKVLSDYSRWVDVDIAVEQKLFVLNVGEEQTGPLAFLEVDTLPKAVTLIHAWLIDNGSISDLRKTDSTGVILDLEDDAQYIKWQWKMRHRTALNGSGVFTRLLAPLITQAMEDPILGQLTPFTSHDHLRLSRCTNFPYSGDCPFASPILFIGDFNAYNGAIIKQDVGYAERLLQRVLPDYGVVIEKKSDLYEVFDTNQQIVGTGDVFTALKVIIEKTYGMYFVFDADGNEIGIGNSERAKNLLLKALPTNCERAIRGTANDL